MKATLDFNITTGQFELLKRIKDAGCVFVLDQESYDDHCAEALSKFSVPKSKERFDKRNFGDTYTDAYHLMQLDLLTADETAWHLTMRVSVLGNLLIEQNS